jgi:hypothetical protein
MFFALRVSNRIRHAFRACVVPRAVRRDYTRFIDFLDLSPAMAREIALIDSLQEADVGIERAAYEVLRLEYLLAAEALRDTTLAPEIATVCERAALGCFAAAGSLALELGLPGEQVARDFRRFGNAAMRHAVVTLRPLAA